MQAGSRLGHFEIRRKIGAGGMGEVYLAEDLRLGRRVAIKILPADFAEDAGRQARFAREARAASALSHPNIAHIYDVGNEDGTHFIAMEYVEGPDLGVRLAKGPLKQDETVGIALQVAGALEEARAKGIIHRDLKPGNIALTTRGEVKILDFGLAKMTSPLDAETGGLTSSLSRTAEGSVLGTAHYMSPEQAQGGGVDTRSDLFSLGAVLYEMVAGRKAFGGDSILGVIHAIIHSPPEALARFNYEVSPELERIILKLLEKDPDNRYQTPRDLLVDLRNLQRTQFSGTGSDPLVVPRKAKPISRRLRPLALVLVAAVAVVSAYFLIPRAKAGIGALAVLPFQNETGDPEVDYLCNGMTESLINTLAQFPDLKVISSRSAFALQGRDLDTEAVGRELGVDAILFGRVVQHGTELTISTELVDARDSRQLWGERYNRQLSEVQSVENEITGTIAQKLKVKLTQDDAALLTRHDTEDPEAYRLYLKGREFTTGTMREMDSAIDYFKMAIEREPDYALAYAGLAQSYTRQCFLRGSERDGTVELARSAAHKAMELDPGLAEAFTAVGLIKMYFDLDWEGAKADLKKGVELGPGSVAPRLAYGDYLLFRGEYEKAVAQYKLAQELDPLSTGPAHDLGFSYMALKQYDKGEFQFRKAIGLNPNWTWGHIKLAKTLAHMGRCQEALAEIAIAEDLLSGSGTPAASSWLAYTNAHCGETAKARAGLAELQDRSQTEYVDPSLISIIQLGLGDLEGAIDNFEKSLTERSPNIVFYKMSPDVYLDELGDDPRFQAMVKKIGFD